VISSPEKENPLSPSSPSPSSSTAVYEKAAGETEAIAFDGRTFVEYHNAVTKR